MALLIAIFSVALGQESPTPFAPLPPGESAEPSAAPPESVTPTGAPEQSPGFSMSPSELLTPSPAPTPEQLPSVSSSRSVRISFVPPPLEGTISLGIYDKTGKLVRVLQQHAQLDKFAVGADGLVTQWDGKNDADQDVPSGKYHAHGYLIGAMKLQDLGESASTIQNDANTSVKIRLIRNPLRNEKKPSIELGIAFDSDGSYLKTNDGLPLLIVSGTPNLTRAWIVKESENAVDVWQDNGVKIHQFRVSNLDQMMAFDCGRVELR